MKKCAIDSNPNLAVKDQASEVTRFEKGLFNDLPNASVRSPFALSATAKISFCLLLKDVLDQIEFRQRNPSERSLQGNSLTDDHRKIFSTASYVIFPCLALPLLPGVATGPDALPKGWPYRSQSIGRISRATVGGIAKSREGLPRPSPIAVLGFLPVSSCNNEIIRTMRSSLPDTTQNSHREATAPAYGRYLVCFLKDRLGSTHKLVSPTQNIYGQAILVPGG